MGVTWTRGADGWGGTFYVGTIDNTCYVLRKTGSRVRDFTWTATANGEPVAKAGTLAALKEIVERSHG